MSETRYGAILHASHLLDNRSAVITLSDGMEEDNIFNLYRKALEIQKKFEVEKAYKKFGIRQLYCFNQNIHKPDYQFILIKLQLMLTVTPYTHLCFPEDNRTLANICEELIGAKDRIIYLRAPTYKSLTYTLNDEEVEKKLSAIERMVTVRSKLLSHNNFREEYIKRIV